jgi:hypothetical protein
MAGPAPWFAGTVSIAAVAVPEGPSRLGASSICIEASSIAARQPAA